MDETFTLIVVAILAWALAIHDLWEYWQRRRKKRRRKKGDNK